MEYAQGAEKTFAYAFQYNIGDIFFTGFAAKYSKQPILLSLLLVCSPGPRELDAQYAPDGLDRTNGLDGGTWQTRWTKKK